MGRRMVPRYLPDPLAQRRWDRARPEAVKGIGSALLVKRVDTEFAVCVARPGISLSLSFSLSLSLCYYLPIQWWRVPVVSLSRALSVCGFWTAAWYAVLTQEGKRTRCQTLR